MAIELDLPLTIKATHPAAYAMIADANVHLFDDYVEVFVNVYDSEEARRQNVPDAESHRRAPLRRLRIEIPKAIYDERIKGAVQSLAAAIYAVLLDPDVPLPFSLPQEFKDGESV